MANVSVAGGKQLVDLGGGVFAEKMVAVTSAGADISGGSSVAQGTHTDRSGTITTGGTAQTLAAANSARRYLFVQNNSAGDLWLRFGGTAAATQPSIRMQPGDAWVEDGTFVNTGSVSIFGATTGQTFSAMEA